MIDSEQYQFTDEIRFHVTMLLAYHCMPALLKLKPSNLVNVKHKNRNNRDEFLTALEEELRPFDCCCYRFYENREMLLLFIYHKDEVERVLLQTRCKEILQSYGYQYGAQLVDNVLTQLSERYHSYQQKSTDFPHEMGIILGYPPADVEDFIRNKGKRYALSGVWKVYHDVEGAKRSFALYHRVREETMRMLRSGRKLSEMKEYIDDRNN